jgi:hypothetical protein
MSATEETLGLLRSIDASLKQLLKLQQVTAAPQIASDRDLDSKYGDPEVKFMPRDWTGSSFKGRHFSECPPVLLTLIADSLEWFGKQADAKGERTTNGKPVGDFKRADAARARGWAKRLLAGVVSNEATRNGNGNGPQPDLESDFGDGDSGFNQADDSFA